MSLTWNISRDFDPVRQTHARYLSERRVGLLGSSCIDARTDTPPLRAALQGRSLALPSSLFPPPTYKLVYCWQSVLLARFESELAKPHNLAKKYHIVNPAHYDPTTLAFFLTLLTSFTISSTGPSTATSSFDMTIRFLNSPNPVPAGTRRPMITFSLSPSK
jgi:hypothetical protein